MLEKIYDCTEWTAKKLWIATEWTARKTGWLLEKVPKKIKGGAICVTAIGMLIASDNSHHKRHEIPEGKSLVEACESYCAYNYEGERGKLTGEDIVNYAKQYVGRSYGLSIAPCRPEEKCTMQCAAFVGSVFRYAAEGRGVQIRAPPGDGIEKCDMIWEVKRNKFGIEDMDKLKPGDIFSSTSSVPEGHTGIYVGKGTLSDRVEETHVYRGFKPDDNGDYIVIHSTKPGGVGYSKLKDITQRREIKSFCRHEALCGEDDGVCRK